MALLPVLLLLLLVVVVLMALLAAGSCSQWQAQGCRACKQPQLQTAALLKLITLSPCVLHPLS